VTFGGSTLPAQPERREAGDFAAAAVSSTTSASVSHAPHAPHCPCHLLKSAPHSLHTYAVFAFDFAIVLVPPGQGRKLNRRPSHGPRRPDARLRGFDPAAGDRLEFPASPE